MMNRNFFILIFSIFNIVCLSVKAETYSIKKGFMSLEFQTAANGKLRINRLAGRNRQWINASSVDADFLWQLSLLDATKKSRVFNSQMFALHSGKQEGNTLTFVWELPTTPTKAYVYIRVEYNALTSLTEWSLELKNLPTGWEGTGAIFPILNINKDTGTKLITSSGYGAEYNLDEIENFNLDLIYPSSRSTMQLVCLDDAQDVLYYATHDKDANLKTFSVKIGNTVELSNNIIASKGWNQGNGFSIPWKVSIGLSDQGWKQSVLSWYRPFTFETLWGKKTLKEKNIPKWLINSDLWLHGGHTTQIERDLTKKALKYFGSETSMHWYYWRQHNYDTNYPDYLPAKEGFAEIINDVRCAGSHIMPYTNGRLWDTLSVKYPLWEGKKEVALKKNQQPYIEVYNPHRAPNAVVCPSSQKWKQIVYHNTKNVFNVLNCDAIYIDQVASARALPCYNESHNHPIGGGNFWHYSYRDIFTYVRSLLKGDQILCTEQNAECYLDLFDLFFMGNVPMGSKYRPAPVFPIVYSDRALTYGFYIFIKKDTSYRIKNALAVLWGAQIYGGRSITVMSGTPEWNANAEYLRELTNFRKQQHDLFVGGLMLDEWIPAGDNPVIEIESWASKSPAVLGAKWLSTQGKQAIVMVNIDKKDHEIVLPSGNTFLLKAGKCHRVNLN